MNENGPSVIAMVVTVAVLVAVVILVFFGVGYLLGKVFL
jgi:preprotein translocase subunit SecE